MDTAIPATVWLGKFSTNPTHGKYTILQPTVWNGANGKRRTKRMLPVITTWTECAICMRMHPLLAVTALLTGNAGFSYRVIKLQVLCYVCSSAYFTPKYTHAYMLD